MRGRQGGRLRPRRRPVRPRGARRRRRRGSRSPPRLRPPSCARRSRTRRSSTMGALTPERARAGARRRRRRSPSGARASASSSAERAAALGVRAARPRQVRHRHGPARRARPGRGRSRSARPWPRTRGWSSPALWTHFATADEPDDGFFARAARALRRSSPSRCASAHPGLLAARRQQRRDAARPRLALRHGPLRRSRSTGSTRSRRDPAARGLEPALELRSYVADVKRFERGRQRRLRPHVARRARDLGRRAADRLRRRRAPGAHQQRRGPRRRAAPAARRHGLDGQHHRRPRPGDRGRARRRGGPDRRPGRRADPRRGGRRRARDDQLRGHLRDLAAGAARVRRR